MIGCKITKNISIAETKSQKYFCHRNKIAKLFPSQKQNLDNTATFLLVSPLGTKAQRHWPAYGWALIRYVFMKRNNSADAKLFSCQHLKTRKTQSPQCIPSSGEAISFAWSRKSAWTFN